MTGVTFPASMTWDRQRVLVLLRADPQAGMTHRLALADVVQERFVPAASDVTPRGDAIHDTNAVRAVVVKERGQAAVILSPTTVHDRLPTSSLPAAP